MRFSMNDLKYRAPHLRFFRTPVALVALAVLQGTSLWAQVNTLSADDAPIQLKSSVLLQEQSDAQTRSALPTFIYGDRLSGRPDLDTTMEGHAELRRGDRVIKADHLTYDQPTDLAKASGQVRINRAGNVYEGPLL